MITTGFLIFLAISHALGSNLSCDFTNGRCGWFLGGGKNCRWEIKSEHSRGVKGYISLVGAPGCSASLAWSYTSGRESETNDMTIEYSVVGNGPVNLVVANDEDGMNWSCASFDPGDQMRRAHIRMNQNAKYIYIKASVGPGSELIINQIWNSLLGAPAETNCLPIAQTPSITTTMKPISTTLESLPTTTLKSIQSTMKLFPTTLLPMINRSEKTLDFNTTMAGLNLTSTEPSNHVTMSSGSTTTAKHQNPILERLNPWFDQLQRMLQKALSTKDHPVVVTGNLTMKLDLKISAKPTPRD